MGRGRFGHSATFELGVGPVVQRGLVKEVEGTAQPRLFAGKGSEVEVGVEHSSVGLIAVAGRIKVGPGVSVVETGVGRDLSREGGASLQQGCHGRKGRHTGVGCALKLVWVLNESTETSGEHMNSVH